MKMRNAYMAVCFVLALLTAAWAADVSGKWTAQVPGRQGNTSEATFDLKAEGAKLTGKMTSQGRQGPTEIEISEGKVSGDDISFKTVREFQGNKFTQVFKGKVMGDEIKFTRSTEGMDNAPPPVEFTAKRAK